MGIAADIATIMSAYQRVREAMRHPDALDFAELREVIVQFEYADALHGEIRLAFDYLVVANDGGRVVGSSKASDFFVRALGASRSEARKRERRALLEYGEVGAKEAAAREERREQGRRTSITREKNSIILDGLGRLCEAAAGERQRLHARLNAEATRRSPEDLQDFTNREVERINDELADGSAAYRKRSLWVKAPDCHGGARFGGYAPPALLALLEVVIAKRDGMPDSEDQRTRTQRYADRFAAVLQLGVEQRDAGATPQGVASLVVSMTVDDIAGLDTAPAGTYFATNTNALLSPLDILSLGLAQFDIGVLHDTTSGRAIAAGRMRRSATVVQRCALFAEQVVCAAPDCTVPAVYCDMHHLHPWARGGGTDLENLTLLCRHHHVDNDDSHTHQGGKWFADRDPVTGRVGMCQPPSAGEGSGPVVLNHTVRQEYSAGHKIRMRNQPATGAA